MKRIFLSILLSVCLLQLWGQDCETGWDVFGYNEAAIVKTGTNAAVTFTVNDDESIAAPAYYWKIYNWDFGDGTGISQAIYFPNNYAGETHVYDLTNTAFVKNGMLQVTAHLTVNYYKDYILRLQPLACYTQDEYVTYAIPSSGYMVNLFADPYYTSFPLNKPINLFYNISTANYSATDNLTCKLRKNGTDIFVGNVAVADLNKNVALQVDTPKQAGTYMYEFILSRYGATAGTSNTLTINASAAPIPGGSAGTGSGLCSDLMPDFKLSYAATGGGKVTIQLTDNSSAEFKRVYAGSTAKYGITYKVNGSPNPTTFQALTNYTSSGFTKPLPNYPQPDIYGAPAIVNFAITMTCKTKSGSDAQFGLDKNITIPPMVFNPNDNTVNLNPNGQDINISLQNPVNSCSSLVYYNPKNPSDELNWLKDYSSNGVLSFQVDSNKEVSMRMIQVTVFVTGNYDKCVDVVNGEKKSYRTINLYQPTTIPIVNVDPMSITNITMPKLNIPPNTDYYSITTRNSAGILATYYFKDINNIPSKYLETYDRYTFSFYDKDGKIIGSHILFADIVACAVFPVNYLDFMWEFADIIIHQSSDAVVNLTNTFYVPDNKSYTLYCSDEINLEDGFEINEGSFFDAEIQGCTATKSARDTTLRNIIRNKTPIASTKKDTIYQSENIVVYPNPSNGSFIIENRTPDTPIISAEIINGQGATIKIMKSLSNTQEVNIKESPAGLYLLKIYTSKGVWEKKILINPL